MYARRCRVPSCAPDVPPIINIQSPLLCSDNKLVPDMTVIPLPMAVSLQPMMITDILPQEQTFVLIGYLFFRSATTMTTATTAAWPPLAATLSHLTMFLWLQLDR